MSYLKELGSAALGGASTTAAVQVGLIDSGWLIVGIGVSLWLICSVTAAILGASHDR